MGISFSPARHPIPADPFRAPAASERYRRPGSSTSHNKAWKHDVFLSFRGEDTRRTITSHLFRLLKERGVDVFIDDGLERGEDISSQLMDTIRCSRISVVIFSQNYADSGWCLQELVEIMECKNKSPGPMVLPVFYDVDPSDVRKQSGDFGKSFAKHKRNKNLARWRAALTEAGKLSGWDMTNPANGPEAEIVRKIAQEICDKLNNTYLDVAKFSVGLEQRMMQVNEHVSDGSNDVRFIVISGIGGVGKTTLAKAVYNKSVRTFEANCFLANIGENSKQPNGLIHLQEQLLRDVLQYEIKLGSVDRGSNVIKERVSSRRVLVILDDLTHRDQMKALAREREWFGPGSRIIVTTRNPDSAKEIKPDFIYPLEGLDDDESLRLFSMHAFGSSHPKDGFTELSKRVVGYCEGLPLALEVLGALLLDQSPEEWEGELRKLRQTPNDDIQKRLEISYDALGRNEKELFLHIACFFLGWTKWWASQILEACGLDIRTGLGILIRRKLVRAEYPLEDGPIERLQMHDLIRDMGKEIVRRESRNPGERSRVFSDDDIRTTLRSHLGTKEVEGLVVPSTGGSALMPEVKADAEAFAGMKRLRMLALQNIHVIGDYGHFSKELRWLCWLGFPLESLPDEFYLGELVIMDMQWSKLRALWGTSKILGHLKMLNLSHSHFLTKTPDFSNLPSLEDVFMEDCRELKEVDASIGHLKRLLRLILRGCKELESLPDSICRVKSLQILDFRGCSKIKQLPDDIGELSSLTHFMARGAPIAHLPPSLAKLENLSGLDLYGSSLDLSLVKFGSLVLLCLRECNLADGAILEGIGSLQLLRLLNLSESIFGHLPISISSLPCLEIVMLMECPELESVPDMPPSVRHLVCSKCPKLKEVSGSGQTLLLDGCHNLSLECRQSILQDWWGRFLVIPGKDMELEYMSLDTPLSFRFCHRCEVHRILLQCCLSLSNYRSVPTNAKAYLTLSSSTRRIDQVELEYFSPGEDNICILSFEPEKFMGGKEYRGVSVALSVVSNPRVAFKGIKIYFERERCPSCSCDQEHPSVQETIPEETVLDEQFRLSVEWSYTPRRGIFSAIGRDIQITLLSLNGLST